MGFDDEYQKFLASHGSNRRLESGLGHAEKLFLEKVWWSIFHHFQYLHPEFEVNDFKDGTRFLGFAYIRPGVQLCVEIDGYGPHFKDQTRSQFSDQLTRQNHLVIDRWSVIRFSYDQIKEQPKHCQQIIQQIIGILLGEDLDSSSLTKPEKEIIRLLLEKHEITPKEIGTALNFTFRPIQKLLNQLIQKNILSPAKGGSNRTRSYRLNESVKNIFLKL